DDQATQSSEPLADKPAIAAGQSLCFASHEAADGTPIRKSKPCALRTETMLAELFMLRLEAALRVNAQTTADHNARFIPVMLPASCMKASSTKVRVTAPLRYGSRPAA